MGIDVAVGAAAADALLQTPDEREFGVNDPILGVAGVVMEDVTNGAVVDHFFGLGDGGDAAVVVANHVDDAGFLGGGDHLLALLDGEGEGFFAKDVFAGLGGGDGDFGVGIVGGVDVDDVDVGGIDDFAPVGGGAFPAKLGTGGFEGGEVAAANGVEFDAGLEREEVRGLTPGVGVGLAHEAVTDHSDAEFLVHKAYFKVGIE